MELETSEAKEVINDEKKDNISKNEKTNQFWNSTPSEYAKIKTDGINDNNSIVVYPLAYLFRSIFKPNFWMFVLVGIIIFIAFKSIITNDLT